MNPYLLPVLVGCLYILVFGGLSLARREGLSAQFALESVAFTALLTGISWLARVPLNPAIFLLLLYLITMRSRWLVDIANYFAGRGKYATAFRLYRLALAWRPDTSSRLIVLTNRGIAELRDGQLAAAIRTLSSVLQSDKQARLGPKYEAACHYTLGLAYEREGNKADALLHWNQAIDILPGSLYARAAQAALDRRKTSAEG